MSNYFVCNQLLTSIKFYICRFNPNRKQTKHSRTIIDNGVFWSMLTGSHYVPRTISYNVYFDELEYFWRVMKTNPKNVISSLHTIDIKSYQKMYNIYTAYEIIFIGLIFDRVKDYDIGKKRKLFNLFKQERSVFNKIFICLVNARKFRTEIDEYNHLPDEEYFELFHKLKYSLENKSIKKYVMAILIYELS
jgi:hypothetical protein